VDGDCVVWQSELMVRIHRAPPDIIELVDYSVRNGILPHRAPHPSAKIAADNGEQRRTNIEPVSVPAFDSFVSFATPHEASPLAPPTLPVGFLRRCGVSHVAVRDVRDDVAALTKRAVSNGGKAAVRGECAQVCRD
jgi:hypothetical protein